jgi:RNA polymerase-binding transcription factor
MAARSPVKKAGKATAAPAKKATKASAPAKPKPGGAPKRAASGRSAASSSRHSAKPPSKSPAKGASKAVSGTTTKSAPKKASKPAAKSPAKQRAKAPAKQKAKPSPKRVAKPAAKQHAKAPTKQPAKPSQKPAARQPAKQHAKQPAKQAPPAPVASPVDGIPKPKFNKEGLGYTKDFDLPFVKAQFELLQRERAHLTGQAHRLEAEAHQLVEEAEMGDVQFDDEGGEGDTMVVERERDLALSAQARDAVAEIDAALARISAGTYGYSIMSGRPIPKERLEAIPWSSVLVEEKVGGIGRR